jgi:hypothetical protein
VVDLKSELLSQIEGIPEFELVDVFVRDGVFKKQEHFRGVVEKGDSDAVAMVSDKYNLVQIRELFRNAVDCCGENVEGNVLYYKGKGDLIIFPEGNSVGLIVQNSVDLSSAVRISFCTRVRNGDVLRIPAEIAAPFVRIHTARDIRVQIDHYLKLLEQVKPAWEQIVASLAKLELTREDIEKLKKDIRAGKRLGEIIDEYLPDPSQETFAPVKFWDFVQIVLRAISRCRRRYRSEFHLSRKIRKVGDVILEWAVFEKLRISSLPATK